MRVELRDGFWAPRLEQLRGRTLPVLLERLEGHGVVHAFRRLAESAPAPRTSGWIGALFSDSDLYKWLEAAALGGRGDLVEPLLAAVARAQDADGYLHTFYGHEGRARYTNHDHGHELYCMGHLVEAGVSHHEATGRSELLEVARRAAAHVARSFGPGLREEVDRHPELELALCRLASRTGERSLVALAAWMVEHALARSGLALETMRPAGHAVRFLYFASGIAEVALATGEPRWRDAAVRLWHELVERHSYCTGAVGGRWMGEAIGRAYELDDETSYAESCAAVAMAQLSDRLWRLTRDPRCLDQLELILYNALPATLGADGASWCYANAHAFTGEGEQNLWVLPFEYGSAMALAWFPPRRHEWLDVMCCPANVARAFACVPDWVAEEDASGGRATLTLRLPLACRIANERWDVDVESGWPWAGEVGVVVRRAPRGARLRVRRPGLGFEERPAEGTQRLALPLRAAWWAARPELASLAGKAFLRRGPVVYALDDRALPGVDLRRVSVAASAPLDDRGRDGITTTAALSRAAADGPLYAELTERPSAASALPVTLHPFHAWPDGVGQLRIWLALRGG